MLCPVAGALRRWIPSPHVVLLQAERTPPKSILVRSFQKMRKTTMMLVGLLLTGLSGFAQTISGSIAGRVVDAQGAVVPNASVTGTEPSKNLRISSKTSARGDFLVPALRPGTSSMMA